MSLFNPRNKNMSLLQLSMPDDFPSDLHYDINEYCQPKMIPNPPLPKNWQEYGAAWSAVKYRFWGMAKNDKNFSDAIKKNGERFSQEHELFCFFVSGLAVVETFSYALYFLAHSSKPENFPINKPWEITLKSTVKNLKKVFPEERITCRLSNLEKDEDFSVWKDIRNILSHRSAPGRIMRVSFTEEPTPYDDIWKLKNINLNQDTTSSRRKWISKLLFELFTDTYYFVKSRV